MKIFWSHRRKESDSELDPDPLVRGTDPRTRIRTKMSRIPNTGPETGARAHLGEKELEPGEEGRIVQRPFRGGVRVPAAHRQAGCDGQPVSVNLGNWQALQVRLYINKVTTEKRPTKYFLLNWKQVTA
jgi:hypothetical protein